MYLVFKVAKVNPKDSSYLLRDDFYKHVRRDWPGYSEEERQLVSRLLVRWVPHAPTTSPMTNSRNRICGFFQYGDSGFG